MNKYAAEYQPLYIPNKVTKGELITQFVEAAWDDSVEPDYEYWGDNPPEAVFDLSGSTRKHMNYHSQLTGEFPAHKEGAVAHQRFMVNHVRNGDGSFAGVLFLGYFHGVPMYGVSTAGEGKGNNPAQEAINKMRWFKEYWAATHPGHTNVVAFTMDTVNGGVDAKNHMHEVGKTIHQLGFPKRELKQWHATGDVMAGYVTYSWMKEYLLKTYQEYDVVRHTTAVAMLHLGRDIEPQVHELTLEVPISPDQLSRVLGDPEASGGAPINEAINYSPEGLWELFMSQPVLPALYPEYYQDLADQLFNPTEGSISPEMTLITQIQGAPLRFIERMIYETQTANNSLQAVA
ncbi:MAG TPA: hypothetical protein VD999_01225 [Vitreimonas sp.]|nr:hypothetical protein [Vitreimonas sp.]